MACASCGVKTADGTPQGCRNNGTCSTGGCNKLNTYDWLSKRDIEDVRPYGMIEVSFKNGARKDFYNLADYIPAVTGDDVVVETGKGYDVGRVTLSGELVRMQMRKKKVKSSQVKHKVLRVANARDLEKVAEAREMEHPIMVKARVIARALDMDMKISDVEVQGDKRKMTVYYISEKRVDFRDLLRHFSQEFRLKIEMRQIGARQETGRLGGIGSCGRELCCSTWLTDFKSVSTAAARYQNLAINQAKLSGQCGRLKCCLNYELDSYMDALKIFPKNADKLKTEAGNAVLIKNDIFKGIMYYGYTNPAKRGQLFPVHPAKAKEIRAMNVAGQLPPDLASLSIQEEIPEVEEHGYEEELTGIVDLPEIERRKRRRGGRDKKSGSGDKRGRGSRSKSGSRKPASKAKGSATKPKAEGGDTPQPTGDKPKRGRRGGRRRGGKNRGPKKD